MDWLTPVSAIILLVLLRVALPIAVTVIFILVFKRLDERWKREADLGDGKLAQVGNVGCWEINKCPAAQRAKCEAYNSPDKPCWQVFRDKNGRLQERCIGCDIFRHAPVPLTA
jgi:hypothetical protein